MKSKLDLRYARLKRNTTAEEALKSICKNTGASPERLQEKHTEKMWIFLPIENSQSNAPSKSGPVAEATSETISVPKSEFQTRDEAEREAARQLKTFQGNIKLIHQNEEFYQFGKVRK